MAGDSEDSTLMNAVVGALVSVVLSFVPFSPAVGGGVAGYLEGGDVGDGFRVGVLSGILAAIPLFLFLTLLSSVFVIVPMAGGPWSVPFAFGAFFLLFFLLALAYTVVLSAVGGAAGVYLARELE